MPRSKDVEMKEEVKAEQCEETEAKMETEEGTKEPKEDAQEKKDEKKEVDEASSKSVQLIDSVSNDIEELRSPGMMYFACHQSPKFPGTSAVVINNQEEENVDYLKELEAELEKAENDVFEIEDITVPWHIKTLTSSHISLTWKQAPVW